MSALEDFQQLKLQFVDAIQLDYEVIRPVVLFSKTVTARSQEVDLPRTTVGEKARRFVQGGMLGLVDRRSNPAASKTHEYPEVVAAHILYLKQVYPPMHYREIVRILKRKFGYETNHHTVKRFLDDHQIPVQLELGLASFHEFEDAYQARWTVVRLYYEGWNKRSIAGYLKLSRRHVGRIIAAFERDGFAGLEDQRHRAPDHPENQLSLPLLREILDIQNEYPRAGRYRVQGLLEQRLEDEPPSAATVGRAMALNRQFHGAPPAWQSDREPRDEDDMPKYLPYRPRYRHQLWFVDIRYLVKLDTGWVYSICVMEGYSRKILAATAAAYQDLIAVLQILRAALTEYGCPEAIVSDNGSVFRAHDYDRILHALTIQPLKIEKGRPWQNLIESFFKIQLRLADHNFERATTLEGVQDYHAEFVETFNTTSHWAHREREDGRRTPVEVLDWVRGRGVDLSELDGLFRRVQFIRTVNRFGFVSVQRFYIYAERGLSQQRVSIWIYDGHLYIEYQQTQLAHYRYRYDRHRKRLKDVTHPTLYHTEFQSPQIEMLELDDEQWLKVRPRPYQWQWKRPTPTVEQLILFRLAILTLLCRCFPPPAG